MKFMTSDEVELQLRKLSVQQVLAKFGRYRIAPGFTVADYVKIGEFYRSAGGRSLTRERRAGEAVAA